MDGLFEGGGTKGSAKLSMSSSKGSAAAEGWIVFTVNTTPLFVPFEGEYECADNECKLSGTCSSDVPALSNNPYFRKGDRLVLAGKSESLLEGSIQSDAREVFKDVNQEVKYNLRFSRR
jgi:hypothetical protein